MAQNVHPSILIATLGAKPQLITLAMDCLREKGDTPQRVTCIHAARERAETAQALDLIQRDFTANFPNAQCDHLELSENGLPLRDITSPPELDSAFRAIYDRVRAEKLSGNIIHFLIAGGRRTLTVFGMAVAQMLFDDRDRLWHIASHPALEESGRLHAIEGEWVRLIPIPVIPWGRLSPAFDALRKVSDPFAAAEQLANLRLREQWDIARIFVLTRLTDAEKNVAELLVREGLSQNEIAESLSISARTVEQHLRSAYRKAEDHWDLENVNQTQLVRLLNLFFVTGGNRGNPQ
jgi:CRISPR-associated Csx14 family protein